MSKDSFVGAAAEPVVDRIDTRYRSVWMARPAVEQVALARYFLPHNSQRPELAPTRPRLIKWYCPFAHQAEFPSGHRYCLNVYTGCGHRCVYCYAAGYEPDKAAAKKQFQSLLNKDLDDLEWFDVPAAPIHLSNSTDPFQSCLEERLGHTKLALERILNHRKRFTTITVLTKNPALAARPGYIALLRDLMLLPDRSSAPGGGQGADLPAAQVEVSLAFWREEARRAYDPHAPSVQDRIAALWELRAAGIPVVLRIDPLFPRSPLPTRPPRTLADFGLCEAQTLEDLEYLVLLAREIGARHVVFSAAKVVQPRGGPLPPAMAAMREVYSALSAPTRPVWRGGSWRLPQPITEGHVLQPFLEICARVGVAAKYCKQNLIETP